MLEKYNPSLFWAKYDNKNGEWLSLVDHSADVAACFEKIISKTILRKRLASLLGLKDLDDVLISRLCVFASLHDVGKCCHGFQNRGPNEPSSGVKSDHLTPVIELIESSAYKEFSQCLGSDIISSWFEEEHDDFIRFFKTTIGHHGKPVPIPMHARRAALWSPNATRIPFDGIRQLVSEIKLWYPRAFAITSTKLALQPEFLHAYAGVLMLADWLGSNREIFPYRSSVVPRIQSSKQAAEKAIKAIGLDPADYREDFKGKALTAPQIFDVPSLRACQQVLNDLSLTAGSSLAILESETGSGKTEAALTHFFNLFNQGLVDSLYFALPTRTAATQLYNRVYEYIKRGFVTPPPVTQAVPGYIKSDNFVGQRKEHFEVFWDEAQHEESKQRHWAAEEPRKYLAGSIVIGTIDQVLLSALKVPYAPMRASALLRHLLVIDEVHASDAYMTKVIEGVLKFHLQAQGHALLMSATLGSDAKNQFLKAFDKRLLVGSTSPLEEPYPLLTLASKASQPMKKIAFHNESSSKKITTTLSPISGDFISFAQQGLQAAREGAKVILLRNTVKDAIETQRALEMIASFSQDSELFFSINQQPTLHHARFCREDREMLDWELQKKIGKHRQKGGFIVIATQTIQQSLDLDADFMITDLCPMDVLLQRLGRLHRHQRPSEERPEKFRNPSAIIATTPDCLSRFIDVRGSAKGPHGFGTVYQNLLTLESTLQLLLRENTLEIPTYNRRYVEETIPREALKNLAKDVAPWKSHFEYMFGKECAEKSIASQGLLDRGEDYYDQYFRDEEKIKTRLGIDDRIVPFENTFTSPFGNRFNRLTLPGHYTTNIPLETTPSNVIQKDEEFLFYLGNKSFIYNRLGLMTIN